MYKKLFNKCNNLLKYLHYEGNPKYNISPPKRPQHKPYQTKQQYEQLKTIKHSERYPQNKTLTTHYLIFKT